VTQKISGDVLPTAEERWIPLSPYDFWLTYIILSFDWSIDVAPKIYQGYLGRKKVRTERTEHDLVDARRVRRMMALVRIHGSRPHVCISTIDSCCPFSSERSDLETLSSFLLLPSFSQHVSERKAYHVVFFQSFATIPGPIGSTHQYQTISSSGSI
jgi:hypothetical protein